MLFYCGISGTHNKEGNISVFTDIIVTYSINLHEIQLTRNTA